MIIDILAKSVFFLSKRMVILKKFYNIFTKISEQNNASNDSKKLKKSQ